MSVCLSACLSVCQSVSFTKHDNHSFLSLFSVSFIILIPTFCPFLKTSCFSLYLNNYFLGMSVSSMHYISCPSLLVCVYVSSLFSFQVCHSVCLSVPLSKCLCLHSPVFLSSSLHLFVCLSWSV